MVGNAGRGVNGPTAGSRWVQRAERRRYGRTASARCSRGHTMERGRTEGTEGEEGRMAALGLWSRDSNVSVTSPTGRRNKQKSAKEQRKRCRTMASRRMSRDLAQRRFLLLPRKKRKTQKNGHQQLCRLSDLVSHFFFFSLLPRCPRETDRSLSPLTCDPLLSLRIFSQTLGGCGCKKKKKEEKKPQKRRSTDGDVSHSSLFCFL